MPTEQIFRSLLLTVLGMLLFVSLLGLMFVFFLPLVSILPFNMTVVSLLFSISLWAPWRQLGASGISLGLSRWCKRLLTS